MEELPKKATQLNDSSAEQSRSFTGLNIYLDTQGRVNKIRKTSVVHTLRYNMKENKSTFYRLPSKP